MKMRYRKSYKIGNNVKFNVNAKSTGFTVGGKTARTTINSSGRITNSVSTPIKGLHFQQQHNVLKKGSTTGSAASGQVDITKVEEKKPSALQEANQKANEMLPKVFLGTVIVIAALLFIIG